MKLKELFERIYAKDGDLIVTKQASAEASTQDAISTFIRRLPYETKFKVADATIYSLFNYLPGPVTTELLSSIKGKGPLDLKPKALQLFFDQVETAVAPLLKKLQPDVVIFPRSSSPLTADFAKILKAKSPKSEIVGDAFIKKLLKADDIEPLINTKHPDWTKFAADHPGEVKKLKQSLAKHIETNGTLELKKLYKPYLKFITNFVEMEDASRLLDMVIGKKVLVVDDVLSSGATMLEMLRQLEEFEPSELSGLTIFKRT